MNQLHYNLQLNSLFSIQFLSLGNLLKERLYYTLAERNHTQIVHVYRDCRPKYIVKLQMFNFGFKDFVEHVDVYLRSDKRYNTRNSLC